MLRIFVLVALALTLWSCNGGGSSKSMPSPESRTTVLVAPAGGRVGTSITLGALELTVVRVSTLTAEEVGVALPGENQRWLMIEMLIVNASDADVPVPDFTLSCKGAIVATRAADIAPEAIGTELLAPRARKVGRLLYSISEPCNPGLLLVRGPGAGGRPPAPVTISLTP